MPGPLCKTATGTSRGCSCEIRLAAESKSSDDLLVFFLGAFLDVIQQLATLGNQGEKATAGREILFVDVQVIREMEYPLGKQGHLVRGTASVSFVELIVFFVDFFSVGHGRRGWIQPLLQKGRTVLGWRLSAEESVREADLQDKCCSPCGGHFNF